MNSNIRMRVTSVSWETEQTRTLELRSVTPEPLPAFTAGAHIDLHLPIGLLRSYSLINSQAERHRYVVGVARDPESRGGSRYILDQLKTGDVLTVTPPKNHFRLVESAEFSVLIGGGIGITPILSMADRLNQVNTPWQLCYAAPSRADAAFVDCLEQYGNSVQFHFDDEAGSPVDVDALVTGHPPGTHLYCCGPTEMLSAFTSAARAVDASFVHLERFSRAEDAATEGGFLVQLARSGRTVAVPAGSTILEALQNAGLNPLCSCQQGICGTCETRVLGGEPDHRDAVLTPEERSSNRTMMICCSGSKSSTLVLDL